MILYMYIAPGQGQGQTAPRTKFRNQQKCLVTSFICCKFIKRMSLKSDFIQFLHDLIQVQTAPRRQNFDVNRNTL